MRGSLPVTLFACVVTLLSGCGGKHTPASSTSFSVGGTITGLSSGAHVTVSNNGSDTMTLSANGGFSFSVPATLNGAYLVRIVDQPAGETCTVSNYSGTGVTSTVSNIAVTCSANTYPIGGTLSGLLPGAQVTLTDNGADPLTISADGAFSFPSSVAYQGSYNVTVATQPSGETCTVQKGDGVSVIAPVTTVSVVCATDAFSIGGGVKGLLPDGQITLRNNGADPLTLAANGSFIFPASVAYHGGYNVTIATQPTGQTCTVANGAGVASAMDVTNIAVICSTNTFTIGGKVSGLSAGTQLVLENDGADPLTLLANGSFTFATPVSYNGSFDVTVGTQPLGQTCTVSSGVGVSLSSDIDTVSVVCAADTYAVGGSITGLVADGLVLKNNGDDPLAVAAGSSNFRFASPVAYNSGYSVTVFQQPLGERCTITNASSPTGTADVTTVAVSCAADVPSATSIAPAQGSLQGGTVVTITGSNFVAGSTSVSLDGTVIPAASVSVTSSTSLTFTTPAHAGGNVAVSVTTPGGTSSAVPDGFTFEGPPTISCSANPSTVMPGKSSTITSVAVSPSSLPLAFSYSATAGSISGSSTLATLDTTGAAPGAISVTCNVIDTEGNVGSASTTVTVAAPPPP